MKKRLCVSPHFGAFWYVLVHFGGILAPFWCHLSFAALHVLVLHHQPTFTLKCHQNDI